jgi:hypothetical protein
MQKHSANASLIQKWRRSVIINDQQSIRGVIGIGKCALSGKPRVKSCQKKGEFGANWYADRVSMLCCHHKGSTHMCAVSNSASDDTQVYSSQQMRLQSQLVYLCNHNHVIRRPVMKTKQRFHCQLSTAMYNFH